MSGFLSLQQIFDLALNGIRKQGQASVRHSNGETKCAYRGEDGCKCAIGHAMPDEYYESCMENEHICKLLVQYPELAKYFGVRMMPDEYYDSCGVRIHQPNKALFLLTTLQRIHDQCAPRPDDRPDHPTRNWVAWESQMKGLAEECGLTYTAPA